MAIRIAPDAVPGFRREVRIGRPPGVECEPPIAVRILQDYVINRRVPALPVVDAKYGNPLIEHHGNRFRNSDLYQAFTYAAALDASAVLVYPKVDEKIDVTLKASGYGARIVAIDLCGPITSEMHKISSSVQTASIIGT